MVNRLTPLSRTSPVTLPPRNGMKAKQRQDKRGFARAARAHHAESLPGAQIETHIVEDAPFSVIRIEADL